MEDAMSQALQSFAPRFEPSPGRRVGSRQHPPAPAFPRLTSLVSRAINTFRLLDRPAHLRRIARSRRILATLARFRGEGAGARAFAYLRTVDPHTFEEVVLSSIEAAGFVVLRNRRYTGDGGVDGRVLIPGTFGDTLNRPGFPRHRRASGNGAARTLPATGRRSSSGAAWGCRTARCS